MLKIADQQQFFCHFCYLENGGIGESANRRSGNPRMGGIYDAENKRTNNPTLTETTKLFVFQ